MKLFWMNNSQIVQLGLDQNELMIYLQGVTPKPVCPNSPVYSSQRGKLPKTRVRAIFLIYGHMVLFSIK